MEALLWVRKTPPSGGVAYARKGVNWLYMLLLTVRASRDPFHGQGCTLPDALAATNELPRTSDAERAPETSDAAPAPWPTAHRSRIDPNRRC